MPTVRPAWSLSLLLAFALFPCTPTLGAQTSGDGANPARVPEGVMAGQRLTKVDPVWPEGEPAPGGNGVITLHVIVRKDGTVRSVDVVSGDPPYCTIAMNAVKQWTYTPYLLNGDPMEVDTTVTIDVPRKDGNANRSNVVPPRRRIRISGAVLAGNLIKGGGVVYPKDARIAGVSGTVVMKVIITKQGAVQDLTVISGPDMLQSAALDAVKQWVYKPYLLNGEPVDVESTITVNFNLAPAQRP